MQSVGKHFDLIKHWMAEQISLQAPSAFLWLPVCVALGVGGYFSLPFQPNFYICTLPLAVCVAFLFFVQSLPRRYVLYGMCAVALGLSAGAVRTALVSAPILAVDLNFIQLSGVVSSIEYTSSDRTDYKMILDQVHYKTSGGEPIPQRVKVTVRSRDVDDAIAPGARVQGLASLRAAAGPIYPGGFDYRRYLFFKGIGATGYFYGAPTVTDRAPHNDLSDALQRFRQRLQSHIHQALPVDEGAIASALIVGVKSVIDDDLYADIRRAGLAHMLAISGLHIGLFAGFVFFVVRGGLALVPYCAKCWPLKSIAAIFAMAAALVYMMIAGATLPTQRSVLMVVIVLFGVCVGRSAISMRLVAIVAMILLIVFPESLLSISFQLSFAAVVGLVAFYNAFEGAIAAYLRKGSIARRLGLYFIGVVCTSCVALMATAPLSLYAFHEIPIYGVAVNFIAIPILTFLVMPVAFLGVFFEMLGGDGVVIFSAMHAGLSAILYVVSAVSDLDPVVLFSSAFPFAYALMGTLGALWFVLVSGIVRFIGAAAYVISFICMVNTPVPAIYGGQDHSVWGVFFAADNAVDKDMDNNYDVREDPYFAWSTTRRHRFERTVFEDAFVAPFTLMQHFGSSPDMHCDDMACRTSIRGRKISFIDKAEGLRAECLWADVIISRISVFKRVKACPARHIVDYQATKNHGAFLLFIDKSGRVDIRFSLDTRGNRPWSGAE